LHIGNSSAAHIAMLTSTQAVEPALNADELEVSRIRALRGPNYWRMSPVIASDVRLGSLKSTSSVDIPGFAERLISLVPTLREHPCSRGAEGGFVARLNEGTHLPHILEHVALELQSLAGCDVSFGRVVQSGDPGVWWVIVAYEEEEVGIASVQRAVEVVKAAMTGMRLDMQQLVAEMRDLYEDTRLGPSTAAIVDEARRRHIPVRRRNSHSLVQLGLGRNLRRIQSTLTDHTSAIGMEIAQDKEYTKLALSTVGLPVPRGEVACTIEEAVRAADEMGYPVLLKPVDSSQGRGISGVLEDRSAIVHAWDEARRFSGRVIVERFHEGRDHRVLVVNGHVVACAERIPAHVTGDGQHTIRELIDEKNRDPRRGPGHRKILTMLPMDAVTEAFLAERGYCLGSVPPNGATVFLRGTANLSTGGSSIDRTDEMHPDNVTACEIAAGIVGLDIAGIDVLTSDISVPFRDNNAMIMEVNAAPGIRMHTHPSEGTPRNVAAPMIDMLYPAGSDTTIPIIAVTGTNGKTTTTRLIAHLFRNTGQRVGLTSTDGVYIQNRLVMEGDMTGPFAANIILSNPSIDVAVLETARGGILRGGLGFEECDVGVVLNVSSDHLGLGGIHTLEQLADVKSIIPAVARRDGHAVLNADDPLVYAMREKTVADVVLFTTREEGENECVEQHVERGGVAAGMQDGQFVIRRGRLRIPIATELEVPLMLGGVARFQRENILAAIASAYVQGMQYDDIRAGLLSFFPSQSLTPGRLNIIRAPNGARVIVDYAHNAAAIEGLVDLVLHMPAARRIAAITVPGDRRDEDIRQAGRLFAPFDFVVIREDTDLRGRPAGAVAGLLREGLLNAGVSGDRMTTILDEVEALGFAVRALAEDEILVALADRVPGTIETVRHLLEVVAA
jgi:cyanophycin synthetase